MLLVGGAEGLIVEAGESEGFAKVFDEMVESAEVVGERGRLASAGGEEDLLEAEVREERDLFADGESAIDDAGLAVGIFGEERSEAPLLDEGPTGVGLDGVASATELIHLLNKAEHFCFFALEEHSL